MMKKYTSASILILSLSLICTEAKSNNLGLLVGLSSYNKLKMHGTPADLQANSGHTFKLKYKKIFFDSIGIEASIDYLPATVYSVELPNDVFTANISTNVSSMTYFTNFMYQANLELFKPYAGLGLGISKNTSEAYTVRIDRNISGQPTSRHSIIQAAYQLFFGGEFPINPDFSLDGRVNFSSFGKIEVAKTENTDARKSKNALVAQSLSLGAIYHF